jgi:hypothetical protein
VIEALPPYAQQQQAHLVERHRRHRRRRGKVSVDMPCLRRMPDISNRRGVTSLCYCLPDSEPSGGGGRIGPAISSSWTLDIMTFLLVAQGLRGAAACPLNTRCDSSSCSRHALILAPALAVYDAVAYASLLRHRRLPSERCYSRLPTCPPCVSARPLRRSPLLQLPL